MPYASNNELPPSVKNAIPSQKAQTMFRRVVNAQLSRKMSDEIAFASAWSALKNSGYKKNSDGNWVKKSNGAVPVYGYRPVKNAEDIIAWAKSQGFTETLAADDMHVTVVYSKTPFMGIPKNDFATSEDYYPYSNYVSKGGKRAVAAFGPDKKAIVLKLDDFFLTQEWLDYRRYGASWDYDAYVPHITISYSGAPRDVSTITPYTGDIIFGPTVFEPLKDNVGYVETQIDKKKSRVPSPATMKSRSVVKRYINDDAFTEPDEARARSYDLGFNGDIHVQEVLGQALYMPAATHEDYLRGAQSRAILPIANQENEAEDGTEGDENSVKIEIEVKFAKASNDQRIVWGWASVSTVDGKPLYDYQGDNVSTEEMTKMANEFMKDVRVLKAMHTGKRIGTVLHSFPLTKELAKSFGFDTNKEGWITGTYVEDDDKWEAAKRGDFAGFSIGGKGQRNEA